MKPKSILWALAFACAAVSCSDDELKEGPNNNNEDPWTGESAQLKVLINTGVTTRASADPEEGDNSEVGSEEESVIKDLTVFLFEDGNTEKDGVQMSKESSIIAKGYTPDDIGAINPTNHPSLHGWEAEVSVSVKEGTEGNPFAGKSYGVLAITNTGSDGLIKIEGINKVSDLADYLQNTIHTTNGYVMSTHMLKEKETDGGHESVVTFPASEAANQSTPQVEVYVERLAAKIRIAPYNNTSSELKNFVFEVDAATSGTESQAEVDKKDQVRLDQVAIVNQLASGSYLLKRATSKSNLSMELDLTNSSTDNDVLLEDEAYNSTSGANFVIDPWTRKKAANSVFTVGQDGTLTINWNSATGAVTLPTDANQKVLEYHNPLVAMEENATVPKTYSEVFNATTSISGNGFDDTQKKAKELYNQPQITATAPLTLAYTMENTTNVANSKEGFSTAALFKATYFAAKVAKIKTTGDGANKEVEVVDTDWADGTETTDAPTFYTYGQAQTKYDSYEAVFAAYLANIQPAQGSGTDGDFTKEDLKGYYFYDSFMTPGSEENNTFAAIKASDFLASETCRRGINDPFGYIKYLRDEASKEGVQAEATFSSLKLQTFTNYMNSLKSNAAKMANIHKRVKVYEKGECYYLYPIRHEDNGVKEGPNAIGPMEFAIVRNNIYDMAVKGISGLGESGVTVPDPNTDNENQKVKIEVAIKVKNWVVRSNSDIIL